MITKKRFLACSSYNWQVPIGTVIISAANVPPVCHIWEMKSFAKVRRKCAPNYDDDVYVTNSLITWNSIPHPFPYRKGK